MQALPHLLPHEKVQFESEAIEVYSKAIEYLENWFDFEITIFKKLEVLSLEKKPTLDEVLGLATALAIEVGIQSVKDYHTKISFYFKIF